MGNLQLESLLYYLAVTISSKHDPIPARKMARLSCWKPNCHLGRKKFIKIPHTSHRFKLIEFPYFLLFTVQWMTTPTGLSTLPSALLVYPWGETKIPFETTIYTPEDERLEPEIRAPWKRNSSSNHHSQIRAVDLRGANAMRTHNLHFYRVFWPICLGPKTFIFARSRVANGRAVQGP